MQFLVWIITLVNRELNTDVSMCMSLCVYMNVGLIKNEAEPLHYLFCGIRSSHEFKIVMSLSCDLSLPFYSEQNGMLTQMSSFQPELIISNYSNYFSYSYFG